MRLTAAGVGKYSLFCLFQLILQLSYMYKAQQMPDAL